VAGDHRDMRSLFVSNQVSILCQMIDMYCLYTVKYDRLFSVEALYNEHAKE
jgi:hypothetical protein